MMVAVFNDIHASPRVPFMVVGDLNGEIASFDSLSSRIAAGSVVDVCAQQHLTGSERPLQTCMAHGAASMRRRDFILVASSLMPYLVSAYTKSDYGLDVHLPVVLTMRFPAVMTFSLLVEPPVYTPPVGVGRQQWREKVEAAATAPFDRSHQALMHFLEAEQLDQFWALWSRALQDAFIAANRSVGGEGKWDKHVKGRHKIVKVDAATQWKNCLLYTSDAADDM
eukprot:13928337-Alexandrium_andersonii.AAC.1